MDPSALQASPTDRDKSLSTPYTRPDHNQVTTHHATSERNRHGWRRVILNFTPSWFSVNMGTGITSILLHNLPYNADWLYWISVVIFVLNILLFVLFTVMSVLRYWLFPGVWTAMLKHPVQSLFLGTYLSYPRMPTHVEGPRGNNLSGCWWPSVARSCLLMGTWPSHRNNTHGPGYDHQHGCVCVRPGMGRLGCNNGLGSLVDRRHSRCVH